MTMQTASERIHTETNVLRIGWMILTATFLTASATVFAHGGKTHSEIPFSRLQALQQATQLFDRLVAGGKLDENWELKLDQVEISSRSATAGSETVVSFTRSEGAPATVFFFFQEDGTYAGSNFSGR